MTATQTQNSTFSKKELIKLLNQSWAISMLNGDQRYLLNAALEKASRFKLLELYMLMKQEQQFLDTLKKDVVDKCVKSVEKFEVQAKAAVQKIKKERKLKGEKSYQKQESKRAESLLKELNEL